MARSSTSIWERIDSAYATGVLPPDSDDIGGEPVGLTRPLRIMHVVDRLDLGGTKKVVMKLIRGCTLPGAATAAGQTRVGGNPEFVAEGMCGCLLALQDVSGLASWLITLQNSRLRTDFGRAERDRALQHSSLDRIVRRYLNLYIGLATRRGVALASTTYVRN